MGFLDQVFGSSQVTEGWKQLHSMDDLSQAEKLSHEKPVVLFKHSVTCGTSAYAKEKLGELKLSDDFAFYYLDLLAHRDVSNEIANRYGVIHQSPQIIILKEGKSIFDTSHHAISAQAIEQQL